jgi:hypothetical protein
MPSSDSNSVRTGVIATVVGGIALAGLAELWPPFKSAAISTWDYLVALMRLAGQSYQIPGWLFGIASLLALITVARFVVGMKKGQSPAPLHVSYVKDHLFGATWRWSWVTGQITSLWCFCPRCDMELVYDDSAARDILRLLEPKTDFICERCNHQVVSSISGGTKSYALSAVRREITRKIRVGELSHEEPKGRQLKS